LDSHRQRTDVEPNFRGRLGTAGTLTNSDTDRLQSGPLVAIDEISRDSHLIVSDFIDATVTFQRLGVSANVDVGKVVFPVRFKVLDDGIMQVALIPFERQNIVTVALNDLRCEDLRCDDLRCDGSLAAGRVDGDDGALNFNAVDKFRNRRDFVGLFVRGQLPETHTSINGPSTDEPQH